jgi:hypothetical protein
MDQKVVALRREVARRTAAGGRLHSPEGVARSLAVLLAVARHAPAARHLQRAATCMQQSEASVRYVAELGQ